MNGYEKKANQCHRIKLLDEFHPTLGFFFSIYTQRTSYLARSLGHELQKNLAKFDEPDKPDITDKDILCLEVAGLCHDLGWYSKVSILKRRIQ